MEKNLHSFINNEMEKRPLRPSEVTGVLVCDTNGLVVSNKDVLISPGPVARLTELATSLSGQRSTICLENDQNQLLIHRNDRTILAIYAEHLS